LKNYKKKTWIENLDVILLKKLKLKLKKKYKEFLIKNYKINILFAIYIHEQIVFKNIAY